MKANLRHFREADVYDLQLHECFSADKTICERTIRAHRSGSFVVTLCAPNVDTPLAIFGGHRLFDRVAEGWALVGANVVNLPIYYNRFALEVINTAFDLHNLHRIQITMRADQPWCHRWAKYLGFEPEGRLRGYGDENVDHFLYAKIRGSSGG